MQHYTRPRVNIDDNDDVCIISDASSTTCGQWPYLCFLVGTSLTTRHLAGRLHLIVWHRDGRAEIFSISRQTHYLSLQWRATQPSTAAFVRLTFAYPFCLLSIKSRDMTTDRPLWVIIHKCQRTGCLAMRVSMQFQYLKLLSHGKIRSDKLPTDSGTRIKRQ